MDSSSKKLSLYKYKMSDNEKVYESINKIDGISYTALVPNIYGLEQALTVGVKEIAIFGSASETFTKKNINCTIVN
jgi:hydroxymethylglutaryl-CoA lyase